MQLSIINQLALLNSICFSFLIFVTSLSVNREHSILRSFGFCFFVPFIASLSSLLFPYGQNLFSSLVYPELSLVFCLAVIFILKLTEKQYMIFRWVVPITSALLLLLFRSSKIEFLMNNTLAVLILFTIFTSICFINVYKLKYTGHIIEGALFSLLASVFIKPFAYSAAYAVFSLAFSFFAYLFFYVFLQGEITKNISQKVSQAEKVLYSMQRTMDIEVRKRTMEIERSNQMLLKMAKTDELTKGYNKTAIISEIELLITSKRSKEFSILMFDIDKFKPINDTYGHPVGDKCIRKLAQIARISIRDLDSFGRFGGDEFIILLPGVNTTEAKIVAERFRKKVEESNSPHFSVSIGIATYPYDGVNADDLVTAADKGLYLSKSKGGNIISHYNSRTA